MPHCNEGWKKLAQGGVTYDKYTLPQQIVCKWIYPICLVFTVEVTMEVDQLTCGSIVLHLTNNLCLLGGATLI